MEVDAETRPERCGEQAAARRGSDEREGIKVDLNAPRCGAAINHYVNAIVLHGRIKVFLDHGAQAVDLVDEEDVVGFERGEQARQIAGFVEHGAGRHFESDAQFVGDDVRQCRLAQSGRPVEQRVVERLPP